MSNEVNTQLEEQIYEQIMEEHPNWDIEELEHEFKKRWELLEERALF